ncbi:carbohydrate kinase family protein [Clostridium sp. Cult2]|uniref:carbohydrate kinase family protein n=1 Tax=Clostridium sp. Cult2 TaxID=2079003 RepID=UPI001F26904E|nr:carbohydrate kinase family protein [Clostridium sp. Cult2]MCF6466227.1 carbohydrate kinase family protein [Clostridium sp. Cult2]
MRRGIAIAGNIAVDEIKYIDKYPAKSELTTIRNIDRNTGGIISNCGITLSRIDYNIPIEIITLVGKDEKGDYLKETLSKYPNIIFNQVKAVGKTPFTDVINDISDKSRTFFFFRGNSHLFNEDTIDLEKLNSKILHIGYILLLDGLDEEDEVYGTKMARLLKNAQEIGLKTSIDIVSENSNRFVDKVPPSLKYTDYCIINEIEAGKSVNVNLRDANNRLIKENIRDVLYKLKKLGVKEWVIIHCPEGSFGYDGLNIYSVPSLFLEKEKIKGTVGAGDAYAAGALYGAHEGLSIEDSMKLATSSAASLLLAEEGASGVKTYNELLKMFEEYPKHETITI